MEKVLPVGTIIDIKDNKFLIIGYSSNDLNNEFGYLIVKYPLGYTKKEQILFLSENTPITVVYYGFNCTEYDEYLTAQKELFYSLKKENTQNKKGDYSNE